VLLIAAIVAFIFLYRKLARKLREKDTVPQAAPLDLPQPFIKPDMGENGVSRPTYELAAGRNIEPLELQDRSWNVK